MNATLNTRITYNNGYIEPVDSDDLPIDVDDAELVESNSIGWGKSNAVVRVDGSYYLATIAVDD